MAHSQRSATLVTAEEAAGPRAWKSRSWPCPAEVLSSAWRVAAPPWGLHLLSRGGRCHPQALPALLPQVSAESGRVTQAAGTWKEDFPAQAVSGPRARMWAPKGGPGLCCGRGAAATAAGPLLPLALRLRVGAAGDGGEAGRRWLALPLAFPGTAWCQVAAAL